MLGNGLLTWILIAAVSLSLALSIVTLILQILRTRSQNNTPGKKTKHKAEPFPSAQEPPANHYPSPTPQAWIPPVIPVQHSNHTEPLFSARQQSYTMPGNATEHLQNNGYHIYIRETSPMGERNYEIKVIGEFPVGRSVVGGLQIDQSTVSRLQCMLIAGPDSVFVSNKSSSNISLLNGTKLTNTQPLKPGDTLSFGNIQLTMLNINKHGTN